jgi:hypothetical protein
MNKSQQLPHLMNDNQNNALFKSSIASQPSTLIKPTLGGVFAGNNPLPFGQSANPTAGSAS